MFVVPTYVASSHIHGVGVFTPLPIRKGTILWRFDERVDWRLSPRQLRRFPEPFRSRLRAYCYLDVDGWYVLCGDNAKYMNHAPDPNCDDSGLFTIARREIAAGEELTCDYRAFDADCARGIWSDIPLGAALGGPATT